MSETRKKVFEVADELLKRGIRPTQQNVREQIGSGSLTTINRGLNEWWAVLGRRFKESQEGQDVPEAVVRLSNRLWNEALAYAEHRYQKIRTEELEASKNSAEQLSEERMKFSAQLSDLNRVILDQKTRIEQLEQKISDQSKVLLESQDECYRLTRELEDVRRHSRDIDPEAITEARVRAEILSEEAERLREQNLQLRAENARLKQGSH